MATNDKRMLSESETMIELERLLAGEDGEVVRDALLTTFQVANGRLRKKLGLGLPPAQFALACACVDALDCARVLLAAQDLDALQGRQDVLTPFSLATAARTLADLPAALQTEPRGVIRAPALQKE